MDKSGNSPQVARAMIANQALVLSKRVSRPVEDLEVLLAARIGAALSKSVGGTAAFDPAELLTRISGELETQILAGQV